MLACSKYFLDCLQFCLIRVRKANIPKDDLVICSIEGISAKNVSIWGVFVEAVSIEDIFAWSIYTNLG